MSAYPELAYLEALDAAGAAKDPLSVRSALEAFLGPFMEKEDPAKDAAVSIAIETLAGMRESVREAIIAAHDGSAPIADASIRPLREIEETRRDILDLFGNGGAAGEALGIPRQVMQEESSR